MKPSDDLLDLYHSNLNEEMESSDMTPILPPSLNFTQCISKTFNLDTPDEKTDNHVLWSAFDETQPTFDNGYATPTCKPEASRVAPSISVRTSSSLNVRDERSQAVVELTGGLALSEYDMDKHLELDFLPAYSILKGKSQAIRKPKLTIPSTSSHCNVTAPTLAEVPNCSLPSGVLASDPWGAELSRPSENTSQRQKENKSPPGDGRAGRERHNDLGRPKVSLPPPRLAPKHCANEAQTIKLPEKAHMHDPERERGSHKVKPFELLLQLRNKMNDRKEDILVRLTPNTKSPPCKEGRKRIK